MNMRDVTICYGMTETSPVSFQTSADDPLEKRVGSVGRIHPHVEVKVVDAEGHVVAPGAVGELCTRGYSVMKGYWEDEEKTADAIDKRRWMHTGDLATLDEDGYCNIVGRSKDMVIRGGENIYPREIEEFIYRHPKVQDVQVIGVPDLKYGEELCAWIKLKPNENCTDEEIRDFCRGQIAHFKIPRYVRFVDAFPMTVTGKIQKYLMRDSARGTGPQGRKDGVKRERFRQTSHAKPGSPPRANVAGSGRFSAAPVSDDQDYCCWIPPHGMSLCDGSSLDCHRPKLVSNARCASRIAQILSSSVVVPAACATSQF